jgi:hypothetical protein
MSDMAMRKLQFTLELTNFRIISFVISFGGLVKTWGKSVKTRI